MLKIVISVDLSNYFIETIGMEYFIGDINLEKILMVVSQETRIPIRYIKSKSRKGEIPDARKLYCVLAREYMDKSLSKIGKLINYDHSEVHWASKRGQFFIEHEPEFRDKYNSIKERLNLK